MSKPAETIRQPAPPPPGSAAAMPAEPSAPERPGGGGGGGRLDHRRHERKALSREALVTELLPNGSLGNTWQCQTADLSRSGMGVVSRRMVHAGTNVFIRVAGRPGEPLFGTVMHFRYLKDGTHLLGIQFATPPARRSIQEWLHANRG